MVYLRAPAAPDEDTSDGFTQGGWFVPYLDETFMRIVGDWVSEADAFLFGRRTYEEFAQGLAAANRSERSHRRQIERAAQVRGLPQPGQGRVGADHHSGRRHPRPGRGVKAATRSGAADPWECPAGSVAAGRRADRRGTAGDRSGHFGPRPETIPRGRRPSRPAVAAAMRRHHSDSRFTSTRLPDFRSTEPTAQHDPGRGLRSFVPSVAARADVQSDEGGIS